MHELGVAIELHRACRSEVERRGGGVLSEVRAKIGDRSGVEPDLLAFAWRAVTEGGPDDGAVLAIEWCPSRQVCTACGVIADRQPGTWLRLCPHCAAPLRVEGGDALDIAEIRYEPMEAAT